MFLTETVTEEELNCIHEGLVKNDKEVAAKKANQKAGQAAALEKEHKRKKLAATEHLRKKNAANEEKKARKEVANARRMEMAERKRLEVEERKRKRKEEAKRKDEVRQREVEQAKWKPRRVTNI